MPGTTSFPAALDSFPEIGPNTQENAPGVEHDVVHANEMAALAAVQAKVGIDGSADPTSLDARMAAVESNKLDAAEVGVSVASLVAGQVPASQLPSFVDDVLEFADLAAFPATGEAGKIYVAQDSGKTYRWSGSVYVEISPSPGSTDGLVEGSLNLYFTAQRVRDVLLAGLSTATNAAIAAGDSVLAAFGKLQAQVNALFSRTINTSAPLTGGGDLSANRTLGISAATASAAGSMSATDKAKLDGIAAGATAYSDAQVRATALTGLSTATATAIMATDTVLDGFGKAQAQINANVAALAGKASTGANTFSGNQTIQVSSGSPSLSIVSTGAGSSLCNLDSQAGTLALFAFKTNGLNRILFTKGSVAEAGSNVGSDAEIRAHTDAGAFNFRILTLKRDSGDLIPGRDNLQNFGGASNRLKEIFCGNTVINSSDGRLKTPLRPLSDAELAVARDLAGMVGVFQWIASVEEKGESGARLHVGLIAQQVIATFAAHGIDALRYGAVCHDVWPESVDPAEYEQREVAPPVTVEHPAQYERVWLDDSHFEDRLVAAAWSEVVEPAQYEQVCTKPEVIHPAGDRYSLRYGQIALLIAAGAAQDNVGLSARVAALEAA